MKWPFVPQWSPVIKHIVFQIVSVVCLLESKNGACRGSSSQWSYSHEWQFVPLHLFGAVRFNVESCTVGHKSHDPCFHVFLMEAGVMTFVAHSTMRRVGSKQLSQLCMKYIFTELPLLHWPSTSPITKLVFNRLNRCQLMRSSTCECVIIFRLFRLFCPVEIGWSRISSFRSLHCNFC